MSKKTPAVRSGSGSRSGSHYINSFLKTYQKIKKTFKINEIPNFKYNSYIILYKFLIKHLLED